MGHDLLSLCTVYGVGGVKGRLIFPASGMERQFASQTGPEGTGNPSETYAMMRMAHERVMRGDPTFRSGQYAGVAPTSGEWEPLEAAVRAATDRKLQKEALVGRPSGSLKSCLKGTSAPKPWRRVIFSDTVDTRAVAKYRGRRYQWSIARLEAHV